MRFFVRLFVVGVSALGLSGCGGGSGLEEGAPEKVDMTKDYSPKVDMPGASLKDMRKAKAAAKAAPAETAPADPSK